MKQYKNNNRIIFKDFLQPQLLIEEVKNAGIFCLPSEYEPWGVVVQEFAASGLPLLISNACGAGNIFVKDMYNGRVFDLKNIQDLKNKIEQILQMKTEDLIKWSKRSNELANCITSKMYVSNFSQFLK